MEDNKPTAPQVMDIQPPKQPEPVTQPDQSPFQNQPETPAAVTSEEVQDVSINDVQEAPVEERTGDDEAEIPVETPILAATAQTPHKKTHAPVLAIVSALIISGALAGLTVYSFMNSDKPKDSATSQTTAVDTPKVDKANAADVDTLNSTIDEDFKAIDDAADYDDAAVSDTTLGL